MKFCDLIGKKIGIFGMGVEGKAAKKAIETYVENAIITEINNDTINPSDRYDVIIKSPGISLYRQDIRNFIQNGGILTSGTNLFFANKRPEMKVIAVTGTKGKSTTAALLSHTLNQAGYNNVLGGNIGIPLLDLITKPENLCVAELSSYQCADLRYAPDIGILTNLYPEHLQWHTSHQQYYADKLNMIHRCKTCFINTGCPSVKDIASKLKNALFFNESDAHSFHVKDHLFFRGKEAVFSTNCLSLRGEHNAQNACAVLAVLSLLKGNLKTAESAFQTFQPLEHRLQSFIVPNDNRTYVDDSISTTPETAVAGLKAFDQGQFLTLIAGGSDRGQDYTCLIEFLTRIKDRCLILTLPETGQKIKHLADESGVQNMSCQNMDEAVSTAKQKTPDKGLILLSPAAPSYNMYKNFIERGLDFQRLALRK